jgi:hypothetical protein
VFILKGVKVLCFDTLLQVFILKVVRVAASVSLQPFATGGKSGLPPGPGRGRRRPACRTGRHRGAELGASTPTPGVLGKEAASCCSDGRGERGFFEITRANIARIGEVVNRNLLLIRYPFERVAKSFKRGEL